LTSHGNTNRVGDMSEAYILIQSDLGDATVVAELAGAIPGVLASETVAGPYDVIVWAQAYDVDERHADGNLHYRPARKPLAAHRTCADSADQALPQGHGRIARHTTAGRAPRAFQPA
jgi:hypothetical protein